MLINYNVDTIRVSTSPLQRLNFRSSKLKARSSLLQNWHCMIVAPCNYVILAQFVE
jgi:hypothetical protein